MSQATAVLERMPASSELRTPAHLDGNLHERAVRELGYKPLNDAALGFRLLGVLFKLGVTPFTDESVRRYMAQAKYRANGRFRAFNALGVVLLIGGVAGLVSFIASASSPGATFSWATSALMVAGILSAGVGLALLTDGPSPKTWDAHDLNEYARPVPAKALLTALRIREEMPAARFSVYELAERRRVDPFLSVTAGNEEYFIAVWDEPTFRDDAVQA
ncbi:MAG TPA: DUF308 domain-containing protein [Candidatus Paceibacterota bacterium]|nr:DUF308 domain-containing protein [Candidatus Paceibacterota bacterium]